MPAADAIATPADITASAKARPDATRLGVLSGALILVSAALQLLASLQRWVVAVEALGPDAWQIEDHLFDYLVPAEPWENVGWAAQLYGLGLLILAAGVWLLAMAAVPARRRRRPFPLMVGIVASVPFALAGAHALLSGIIGVPSPIQTSLVVALLHPIGLAALAVLCARRCVTWTLAAVSLAASAPFGIPLAFVYAWVTFELAPEFAGYQSHDTTPWSETIVAVFTAITGALVLIGVAEVVLRERMRERRTVAADGDTG